MRWKYYSVSSNDQRATAKLIENLRCGHKSLVDKLLARFNVGSGAMFVIEMEGLDVESLPTFSYATFDSGKNWFEATGVRSIPIGDRPIDGLISFLTNYLQRADRGIVVIQNPIGNRSRPYWNDPERLAYCIPTHHAFYHDEVHHIITLNDARPDYMEDAIREGWHHWFVGVCASRMTIADESEFTDESLSELVHNTQHIFVPAFDGDGFLVWTP